VRALAKAFGIGSGLADPARKSLMRIPAVDKGRIQKEGSFVDGVILSVAVLQGERRISTTMLSARGDPSARLQERGLFGMTACGDKI